MADVVLAITISDAIAGRVLDAVCAAKGYQANGLLGDQPTKVQFAQQVLADFIKATVADHEAAAASRLADSAARAAAEAAIVVAVLR